MNPNNYQALPSVLLVHNRYRIPGGEDMVYEAERALLEAHGHRVVCYERSNAELDGAGILGKLLLPLRAVYSRRTKREVRTLIRSKAIDIVHVHNTLTMVSPSVFAAARAEGVPAVHTLHNFRLLCPNGIFLREGQVCEDCPQKGLSCAVKHRCYRGSAAQSAVNALILWVHRLLGTWRHVGLIAITEFDREKFLKYNGKLKILEEENLYCKPHIVEGGEQPALPWSEREDAFLFAGRLEELKGVVPLLNGWKTLPDKKLILVGDGPLEGWAKKFSTENGLNVEFRGRLPHADLLALTAKVKGVIVPSLCYESFGLAAAEALMAGTPVLGSDLGNTGAFITPGVNGLRFAAGNAAALAEGVRDLDDLGASLNLTAVQAEARRRFGAEENYQKLMEIYRDVLNREGAS